MKKHIPIEQLLRIVYRDELPKRETAGSFGNSTISGMALLGTAIDKWESEPGMPIALGDPHPDALEVEAAVNALRPIAIDGVEGRFELAPECARCIAEDDFILRHLTVDVAAYVTIHARMGNVPPWELGAVKASRIVGGNGKPVVVGLDKNYRYETGAHCPVELLPDAREVISDRATYVAWHRSLVSLAESLANHLADYEPTAPELPERPWIVGLPQIFIIDGARKSAVLKHETLPRRSKVA